MALAVNHPPSLPKTPIATPKNTRYKDASICLGADKMLANCELSKEEILASTETVPFSAVDRKVLQAHLLAWHRQLDLSLDIDPEEMFTKGVLLLKPVLAAETVMLVNFRGGKGYLGRPGTCVFCFYSARGNDDWVPMGAYPQLKVALGAVGNMYGYTRNLRMEISRPYSWAAAPGNPPSR